MSDNLKNFRLDGKVALITGAGRGLGADTARALASAGAKVMIGDVLLELAEATAAEIRARGGQAKAIAHDVTKEAEWEHAIRRCVEAFGGLDILINNAGIERVSLLTETSVEAFRLTQEINVTGTFLGIKHAARAMRPGGSAGKGGAIVNLSSVAGLVGLPALGGYCAAKGAVRLLTKAAAIEFAKLGYGIRVNSVHPAIIKTEMGANVVRGFAEAGLAPDEATADALVASMHPMGYGTPQDVANAVLYLASDASRWSTGSELVIDGGASAC